MPFLRLLRNCANIAHIMSGNAQKKSLFISSYAPPAIGGPQNLYTLLRDAPRDSYATLTSFYNIDNFSARNGLWLSDEYFFYDHPSGTKKERIILAGKNDGRTNVLQAIKRAVKRIDWLKTFLGIPIIFIQIAMIVRVSPKIVRNLKADNIVAVSDYGPAMIGGYITHKKTGKPLILFMFDLYKGNYLPFPGGILASIYEPTIFRDAKKIIVTNEGTKDFYIKRYGKKIADKITVIHNSVFQENHEKIPVVEDTNPEPPYSIVFTGRVSWPQLRSLKDLINIVENSEPDIVFNVYSPNPKDYLANLGIKESDRIKINSAPPENIPEIQGSADILFLPLSWHTKSQQIIDTATPGKLTDYLISGKPILIYAPASSFLVKYARENNFAAIVDQENPKKLEEVITKLLTDVKWRKELVENAKKTFYKNHNAIKNSIRLSELLNK
jgi:glycosyltransferase involved in cell wall biosynthesis